MSARHELERKLAAAWPPADWADVTVLLAISGGCDSVALLQATVAIRRQGGGRICAAHVNHQLRADADADESFVVALCGQLGVPCTVGRVALTETPDGIEATARAARYRFLEEAAGRLGARYVVTAHTADDQIETILHRVVRGTGIGGLAGMSRVRPLGHATLIRPLLGIRRAELEAYLDVLGQPFREDLSNIDTRFTRNRIRHELLPWLKEHINPGADDALLRLGTLAGEVQAVVDRLVGDLLQQNVTVENPDVVRLDLTRLGVQPRYLLRELLIAAWRRQGWPMQSMGFAQWDQLSSMAAAATAGATMPPRNGLRQTFPGNVLAEVSDGQLRLTRA